MEKIATDIYSFENLRKGGYVYVDKTDLLWRLAVDREGRQFFIFLPDPVPCIVRMIALVWLFLLWLYRKGIFLRI